MEARLQRAREVAQAARQGRSQLQQAQRTSAENPDFISDFFAASRLHFIGSWKSRFEQLCDALRPGGVGYLHVIVSTSEASRFDPCNLQDVVTRSTFSADKGMHMHFTPSTEIRSIFERRGCTAIVRAANTRDHERFTNPRVGSKIVMLTKALEAPGRFR